MKIGVDIVEVSEFRKAAKSKRFVDRLFTKHEISYCKNRGISHLASRFAAKEAFMKATGFSKLKWHDVEVRNLTSGKPYFWINKVVKKKLKIKSVELSISQTKKNAVAVVLVGK